MKSKISGYGIVEYIIGVGALVGVLFVPYKMNGKTMSTSSRLIEAVKTEHAAYIYAESMPYLPKKAMDKKK